MAKKDHNKKHYFSPVKDDEKVEMLKSLSEEKGLIRAWQQGKSEKEVEDYLAEKYEDENCRIFMKSQGGLLSKLSTSKNIDKNMFLKIGEGKFQYFSTATLRYFADEKLYYLDMNNDMYKSQQRSNYRLIANVHNKIQIRINGEIYDGLDISAGGTSFNVPEDLKDIFEKEKEYQECELLFNRKKFMIPTCRIAAVWPLKDTEDKPTGELGVGIQFKDLKTVEEEALFKHINSEARAEEMRKKMLEQASKKKNG